MGCCGCFSFFRKSPRSLFSFNGSGGRHYSQDFLLPQTMEDAYSYNGDSDGSSRRRGRSSEDILLARARIGIICREVPVKETRKVTFSEDENGNKMVNEYVREGRIGSGSYGKVVLYRNIRDGNQYAMEDENGNKMVNEYVREGRIGSGSYGEVVLYRNIRDGNQYAMKVFHKSHLLKLRVAPSETAMTDVLREYPL